MLGIEHAVDIARPHVERGDPGRGMQRREDHEADGRCAIGLGLAQFVAHHAAAHGAILRLDDDAQVRTARELRVDAEHEVALLAARHVAGFAAGAVHDVAGAARELRQDGLEQRLEVGALGRRLRPLGSARGGRCLDGGQSIIELGEAVADLGPELVQGRVHPRGVQQQRQLRGVAVEVGAQQLAHPANGAVALGLVEQFADHRAEGAAVTEELLQGARELAVAVGEVLAQHVLERAGRPLVGLLGLGEHPLELAPDHVHVDADASVLEGRQADAQRALHHCRAFGGVALGEECGEPGVQQRQALHDDAVRADRDVGRRDLRRRGGGERDQLQRFHAAIVGHHRDS